MIVRTRYSGAARRALSAALLFATAIAVAGCSESPRNMTFRLLAGEAPGERPGFVPLEGRERLGNAPPPVAARRFRPAPEPEGKPAAGPRQAAVAQIAASYARFRQALSDRDDEAQFRRRTVRVEAGAYLRGVAGLAPNTGDPVPPNTPAIQARLQAADEALARLRAEVLRLHGAALRNDRDRRPGADIRAAIDAVGKDSRLSPANRSLLKLYRDAIDKSEKTSLAMSELVKTAVANYLEYLSGQQAALENLRRQITTGQAPAGE